MKIDLDDINEELLQDLIDRCEDKMASPFKAKADKKKLDLEEMMKKKEEEESGAEEEESEESSLDDLSKEELIAMYERLKGK